MFWSYCVSAGHNEVTIYTSTQETNITPYRGENMFTEVLYMKYLCIRTAQGFQFLVGQSDFRQRIKYF